MLNYNYRKVLKKETIMSINLPQFAVRLLKNRKRDGVLFKHKLGFYITTFDVNEVNKKFAKVIKYKGYIQNESKNSITSIAYVGEDLCLLTYKVKDTVK